MEKNGLSSAGPRSEHVDICYFWIKDRTNVNDITIRRCLTTLMLAYFFTKPLQGVHFTRFCDVILGHKHINSLDVSLAPNPKEHVGREQANGCRTYKPDNNGLS